MTKPLGDLFSALETHVMVYGGANRHDLLIGLTRLRHELREADDHLREYAAERSHGATANAGHLDRCAAAARFHLTHALSLSPTGDRRDG